MTVSHSIPTGISKLIAVFTPKSPRLREEGYEMYGLWCGSLNEIGGILTPIYQFLQYFQLLLSRENPYFP